MKPAPPGGWTASHRGVLLSLLTLLLAYILIRLLLNPVEVPNPQAARPPRAGELQDQVDPNTAEWNRLAALPNIGEKRAKDIVAYREQFLKDHPGMVAFNRPADLQNVRGIGPAIVAQLRPFLRFPSDTSTTLPTTRGGTGDAGL